MPLRILHVLSSNFFAGSVAYALQLAEWQAAEGHEPLMVTDRPELSPAITCLPLPVSDRSLLQRFQNVRFLRSVIREREINVVHAHSRAASWVSYYAVCGTGVPLVSTIHGRQVKHSRPKSNAVYGDRVIAICPNLMEHLEHEMNMEREKLEFIPNPLDFDRIRKVFGSERSDGRIIISVIGRLNGPKGDNISALVSQVFPQLLERFPLLSIRIAGGEWAAFPSIGKDAFANLRLQYGERICHVGFTYNILELMANSNLVIGAGRVAMEAAALGTPVLAVGEACSHGLLTEANLNDAIGTNFGDILPAAVSFSPDLADTTAALSSFLQGGVSPGHDVADKLELYDSTRIMPKVLDVYRSAIMRRMCPSAIPVLMYHRVPDTPIQTRHKTFVTRENFEKQMRFFSRRGLNSITFKEYQAFSNGDLPARTFPPRPFIITFDDGYLDNFTNMLPLATEYGFKGVLFLLGDFSVAGNFWDAGEDAAPNRLMTTEQKGAFVESGWEIGAHTLTHPDLTLLNDEEALYEISESKKCIEAVLQTSVVSFAYPFGTYDGRIKELARRSGVLFGIATDSGGLLIEDDRFAVFRVNMFPEESMFSLFKKTSSWYRKYYKWKRGT